jgi:hypothetical protein
VKPPESYEQLARWARRCGVDAIAMGSPYTPRTAGHYDRFDGDNRDLYYRADFDKRSVMDRDEVQSMLAEAQQAAGDGPYFFLDNETPKARFGHLWWVGYHYDLPPWHDYDQPFDRWMINECPADDTGDEPMPYERRPYLQIMAIQRAHGALGFWAHPTSWWRGARGQFVTNIASEMPCHAIADGRLDGMVVMGYHAYRPQYLALWHELLDRGYRVPGVAEMDCGLSDPKLWERDAALLNHAALNGSKLSTRSLVDAFRRGAIFASSGPFITLKVDGHAMGDVAPASDDRIHDVEIEAYAAPGQPQKLRIELLGSGERVIRSWDNHPGGLIRFQLPGTNARGYVVAQVFGNADAHSWRDHRQFATSNPVYLHPRGSTFNAAATTLVILQLRSDSPYRGGEIRFENAAGELLLSLAARRGVMAEELPASGRVTLLGPTGERRTDYFVNSNPQLLAVQRYLYRGRFLLDFPSLQPGELPTEAWRLDRYIDAMRQLRLTY